jgi:RNA polymerase sigma-70 factor (ECF subfamily)
MDKPVVTPPRAHADVLLMEAVAARDSAAQRELVERLGGRVRKVAGFLCASTADADDAAQASLLEIIRCAASFRTAVSLERWAERITVRTTLRSARREHERRGLVERWLPPGALPWASSAERNVEFVGVEHLLERLSPERRQALVLHHGLDFTVSEIAELTGVPVGTVKDRLIVARKQLRKVFERDALRIRSRGRL